MIFKRINPNTINCIITPEDMKEYGIVPDDLFERREEGLLFLRKIMERAQREEKIQLQGDFTSMRLSVLPDHSLSLTLSGQGARVLSDPEPAEKYESTNDWKRSEYVFRFPTMHALIRGCEYLTDYVDIATSVYRMPQDGSYYLTVTKLSGGDDSFERIVLSLNEFGEMMTGSRAYLSNLKEHATCLIENNAALTLTKLSD